MYEEKINAYFDAPERRAELVEAISRLVRIRSVREEPLPGMPFGPGPAAALAEGLKLAEELGFATRLMFANSEFLVLLNQAATDRAELAKLLNISENQMGYVTNAEAGHGLLRVGGAIVPFANEFPRTGALYQLWNTTPTDK